MPFYSGLDVGQAQDYTALAVLDQQPAPPGAVRPRRYEVRHLERWELGTPYTALAPGQPSVCGGVAGRFAGPPLAWSMLAVDFTGVGRPVVDQLAAAKVQANLTPILITGGHATTRDEATKSFRVPKKDLVSTLQVFLQAGLLRIEPALPLAAQLAKELGDFRAKITAAANETFGAWRDGQHDDLVLAVALALWLGEKYPGVGLHAPQVSTAPPPVPPGMHPAAWGTRYTGRL